MRRPLYQPFLMLDDALTDFLETNPRTKSLDSGGWKLDTAVTQAQDAPMTLLHIDGWKAVVQNEQGGTFKLTMMDKANPQLPTMPASDHVLQGAAAGAPVGDPNLPMSALPANGPEYYVTIDSHNHSLLLIAHRDEAAEGILAGDLPAAIFALFPSGSHDMDGVWEMDQEPADAADLIASLVQQGLGWNKEWHSLVNQSCDPAATATLTNEITQRLALRGLPK